MYRKKNSSLSSFFIISSILLSLLHKLHQLITEANGILKNDRLPLFTLIPAKFILIVHKHIRSCKAPTRPEKAQTHCKT